MARYLKDIHYAFERLLEKGNPEDLDAYLNQVDLASSTGWQEFALDLDTCPIRHCIAAMFLEKHSENATIAMLDILFQHGAQAQGLDNYSSPLQRALSHNLPRVALHLIEVNGAVDAQSSQRDSHEAPAWLGAAKVGDPGMMAALVQAGCQLDWSDENGTTALMVAADYGHIETLRWLLDAGANPYQEDVAGQTAEQRAEDPNGKAFLRSWRERQALAGTVDATAPTVRRTSARL